MRRCDYRYYLGVGTGTWSNYVTIVAPQAAVGYTKLDTGVIPAPDWKPLPYTGPRPMYYTTQYLGLTAAEHTVEGLGFGGEHLQVGVWAFNLSDGDDAASGLAAGFGMPSWGP